MCGIVGYSGPKSVEEVLIRGLKRLEYRGYDSSGIALMQNQEIVLFKAEGKLENVEKLVKASSPESRLNSVRSGIGHTRWATHGKPSVQNAHPHQTGHVVIVHNGIIENYLEIREQMIADGFTPKSETDSELFGFLVLKEMNRGLRLRPAVSESFRQVRGACSVVVMSEKEPGTLIGVRNGSPLAVAKIENNGGMIIASDAQPIVDYTKEVYFIESGDGVELSGGELTFFDWRTNREYQKTPTKIEWSSDQLDKQGFDHFMLKEIHEQPTAMVDTINSIRDKAGDLPFALIGQPGLKELQAADEIIIIACGSSYYAGLLGKYWIERYSKIPVQVELASEFRYRSPLIRPKTVVIGLSQSGETADTLAVIRDLKAFKATQPSNQSSLFNLITIGITNVRGSSISREADACLFTCAGPEIGVAATKSFCSQLTVLFMIAGFLARNSETRKLMVLSGQGVERENTGAIEQVFQEFLKVPHLMKRFLEPDSLWLRAIEGAADALLLSKGFFFIGRGYSYPIAMEGALKLKEIAYVHAEGYAAGELKHGPIAMLDKDMTVVVLAPQDSWREKTVSNLEEVKARGAKVLGIGLENDDRLKSLCDYWIPIPLPATSGDFHSLLYPFLLLPTIQLFSYRIALKKGTDVDKPRNLAKSVTVE